MSGETCPSAIDLGAAELAFRLATLQRRIQHCHEAARRCRGEATGHASFDLADRFDAEAALMAAKSDLLARLRATS